MGKIVDIMHHGYHFEAKSILYLGLADEFHGDVVDFFATGLLECDQNRKMISYTEKGNQFLNNLFRIKDGEPNCMDSILLLLEMTGEISRNKNGEYQLLPQQANGQCCNQAPQITSTLCAYNADFAAAPAQWILDLAGQFAPKAV